MKNTAITKFIGAWLSTGNQYDVEKYLSFYLVDAVLNDPSVGRKFTGHTGIKDYFVSYFIGYRTQTKLVKFIINNDEHAHLEVEFTGDFPERKIGGTFDFTFKDDKIAFVKANLVH
ncbi:hypothetical protein GCM10023149_49530 [Mucilaginibacter gynuensis]|uniref:SnoaL-like domain-containing protein n=1 Tax=Mucilaginibacter gynuensis TaxID=1302236 RepID=A0ABP8HGJ1_9SPHI